MKPVKNLANGKTRRRTSLLRRAIDFAFYNALPNHTPAGPGSIGTGQSAAAGPGGPYIGARIYDARPEGERPSYMEYAAPLRQVFWI